MRIAKLLLAISVLSGCAASIPEGMPTAMIRFNSNVRTIVAPACMSDRKYVFNGMINMSTWSEVSPVKMLGTRPDKTGAVMERLTPAEREFAYVVSGTTGEASAREFLNCKVFLGFKARQGEQYEVNYTMDGNVCRATLSRLTGTESAIQRAPVSATFYRAQDEPCDRK
jgi:hypothetical protein